MESHHAVAFVVSDVASYDVSVHQTAAAECTICEWPQLGIDEARSLSAQAYVTPDGAATRLLIVRTSFITHEAQNALLKLFEEPPLTTRFVLIVPTDLQWLPTLRSRLVLQSEASIVTENEPWTTFLSLGYAERVAAVEQATKSKDITWQRAIKRGLVAMLTSRSIAFDGAARTRLQLVAERLLTRGASNKMLLEELALTLPTRV
ncbi:hypothetical protein KC887_03895 [Candidatus Kaiserbacteria bacterium]|nr:hypothetical protein [Candidatus Kaiserbacteria bacterium]